MKNILKRLIGKRTDDEFITLMQAALDDQTIREQLLSLLALPPSQRLVQLQKWATELREEQAPAPLINAIRYLEDDNIARRALEILNN